MVLNESTVHCSTLTTISPVLKSSKSHQSVKHIGSVRFRMSRIFKKLRNSDDIIRNEIKEPLQLPRSNIHISETTENDNTKSDNPILAEEILSTSKPTVIESFERLPFTESYFSISDNKKKFPFELSTYHKNCIRQEKIVDQKQYPHELLSTKFAQLKSFISTPIKEHNSNLTDDSLTNANEHQSAIKTHGKKSNFPTTLTESTSIENHIGLKYASRRNLITNSNNVRSSYTFQHLRRLQSRSQLRPISNETKTIASTTQNKCSPSSAISSSIAHRIELLKKSMHKNHFESDYSKLDNASSHPLIHKINKETQTHEYHLNSLGFRHIHYHHFNVQPFLSIEWRTYFAIIGTLSIIFLLLMELITIIV